MAATTACSLHQALGMLSLGGRRQLRTSRAAAPATAQAVGICFSRLVSHARPLARPLFSLDRLQTPTRGRARNLHVKADMGTQQTVVAEGSTSSGMPGGDTERGGNDGKASNPSPAGSDDDRPGKNIIFYCTSMLALGFSVNAVGPMLPTLAMKVGVEPSGMGIVLGSVGAGGFVGALASGPLLERFRIKTVMMGTLASLASVWALVPSTTDINFLALEYAVAGACYQLVSVAAHQAVQREYGSEAGPPINLINGVFGVGSLMVPALPLAVSAALAAPSGLETYWLVGVMCLAAAAAFGTLGGVVNRIPEPPSAAPARDAAGQAEADLQAAERSARDARFVIPAMLFIACSVGAETTYGAWLYSYAAQGPAGLSAAAAAAAVSTFWVSFTAGRFLGVPLSSRYNPRQILSFSVPLAILAPAAVMAAPESAAVLFAASAASGLGLSSGFPSGVAMLSEYVLPSPQTQSKLQIAACTGSLVFPPLVPVLASALPSFGLAAFLPMAGLLALSDLGLVRLVESLGRTSGDAVASKAE